MGTAPLQDRGLVPVKQFQAPGVRGKDRCVVPDPRHDLGQAKRGVGDNDRGPGGQCGGENMGAFPFGRRGAVGQHLFLRIAAGDDVGDRESPIHLHAAVADALHRNIGPDAL